MRRTDLAAEEWYRNEICVREYEVGDLRFLSDQADHHAPLSSAMPSGLALNILGKLLETQCPRIQEQSRGLLSRDHESGAQEDEATLFRQKSHSLFYH